MHAYLIKREEIALEESGAGVFDVRRASLVVHSAGVIGYIREVESEDRVDVDNDHAEERCQAELSDVSSYSLDNILQRRETHDNIEQVQTVDDVRDEKTHRGDGHVEQQVEEISLHHHVLKALPIVLQCYKEMPEISASRGLVKLRGIRSL